MIRLASLLARLWLGRASELRDSVAAGAIYGGLLAVFAILFVVFALAALTAALSAWLGPIAALAIMAVLALIAAGTVLLSARSRQREHERRTAQSRALQSRLVDTAMLAAFGTRRLRSSPRRRTSRGGLGLLGIALAAGAVFLLFAAGRSDAEDDPRD